MNNNEINEFSPEQSDDDSVKEFNPYSEFLDDDKDENLVSNAAVENDSSKQITTEDDIEIPDFLRTAADVTDFKKTLKENPSVNNGSHPAERNGFSPANSDDVKDKTTSYSTETGEETDFQQASYVTNEDNNDEEQKFSADTFNEKEEIKFIPKISASEADNQSGGKPRILNKKFLLTLIIIVVGGVFLISFLMPAGSKKKAKNEKPVAETYQSKDYASIAQKHPIIDEQDAEKSGHYGNVSEEKKEVEIPPVIIETNKKPYEPQYVNKNTGNGGGSSSAVEIPDTRNDSLQSKRISGIKGLSSTQETYSTDYQQTIAKNIASTSAISSYSLPSKDEYMSNVLNAYSKAYGNAAAGNNNYNMQNDQSGKNSFFNTGRNGNNVGQGEWLNLNTLWQGSIFEAVLTSELNTDLPGEITARIAKNIYSSQDGRYLLIPQNSIVYGTYNSSISYSQSRVQVAWHTLVRPDGYQIQLGNMNGTDAKGASGLKGFVNDHPWAYLKAIGLMSVFSIVNTEFAHANSGTQNEYVQNIIANGQQVVNELGDKLIERAMNVQPTIKIKAGTKINIVVNQNLSLPPCEDISVTQPYKRMR